MVRNLHVRPGSKCVLISDEGNHWRVWLGINKLDAKPGNRYGTYIALYANGRAETVTLRPDGEEFQQVMDRRS